MLPDPKLTSTFPEFTVNCAVIGEGAWAFGPPMSWPSHVISFEVCARAPNAIKIAKPALANVSPVVFDPVFTNDLTMLTVRVWQGQHNANGAPLPRAIRTISSFKLALPRNRRPSKVTQLRGESHLRSRSRRQPGHDHRTPRVPSREGTAHCTI